MSDLEGAIDMPIAVLVRCNAKITFRFVDKVTVIRGVRKLKLMFDHRSLGPVDMEEPPIRFSSMAAILESTTVMILAHLQRVLRLGIGGRHVVSDARWRQYSDFVHGGVVPRLLIRLIIFHHLRFHRLHVLRHSVRQRVPREIEYLELRLAWQREDEIVPIVAVGHVRPLEHARYDVDLHQKPPGRHRRVHEVVRVELELEQVRQPGVLQREDPTTDVVFHLYDVRALERRIQRARFPREYHHLAALVVRQHVDVGVIHRSTPHANREWQLVDEGVHVRHAHNFAHVERVLRVPHGGTEADERVIAGRGVDLSWSAHLILIIPARLTNRFPFILVDLRSHLLGYRPTVRVPFSVAELARVDHRLQHAVHVHRVLRNRDVRYGALL
ncbi:cytokinin hydroxylase-like protein, putative [Babesia caballi]|uniref:Cytokinin hydroxylase-like protein, putative n=1 Tax=Babesia caballi TaxID=5871 RepID=A0AAV4LU90_BABCB|nr:cytokinin hydroxylase-like protein, putative [Babesia caballi]